MPKPQCCTWCDEPLTPIERDYPERIELECRNPECGLGRLGIEDDEDRWQDYLNDTYVDEYGDRQRYG